jgi:hypothetical protein
MINLRLFCRCLLRYRHNDLEALCSKTERTRAPRSLLYALLYKDHTLVVGAAESTTKGQFIPVVYIAWNITPTERGEHSLISHERYSTFEEASAAAFADAKAWVDRHSDGFIHK